MSISPVSLLIVDDDPVFALFVRQLVLSLGDEFVCAPEWVDTADKAMTQLDCTPYDLVLLDYNLPEKDGLQLLAQVRGLPSARQPAVVMLTGSGNESVAVEAMKRGAKDYLPKAELDVAPLLRALRNALTQKRLADQIARHDAQSRADLEMARRFQQSLLPDNYPAFPPSASPCDSLFRFCHRFCPASELAGDFFSVSALSDTEASVFICDVMGHGVRSALVTAILRALVDVGAPQAGEPAGFLAGINRRLARFLKSGEGPIFATAFYLVADAAKSRLRYATAGHPPPLHLRRRAGLTAPLPIPPQAGPALGLFAEAAYAEGECPLATGDVLLLFTDGLFEVTTPDGQEEYGQHRLLAAARQHMNLPPQDLCDTLIAGVRDFAGTAAFGDDVCLLGMEVARLRAERVAADGTRKESEP